MIPVHAQGSAPGFIQTIQFAYVVTGPEGFSGTLTPGNSPETHPFHTDLLSSHNYALTPTVIVAPGSTGNFNLTVNEVVVGGNSTNFTPSTQTLPANVTDGIVPYVPITASVDNARFLTYQLTLTPSNIAYPSYYLEITFDEDPPGSTLPAIGGGPAPSGPVR